ncbi:MAG: MaoC/PaaZ C-terminal domain-containing protein [Thermodesulfobacteriota bacterium]|nr:MaoC/PaaZ C-terminal domain-containing protein [Thermodesulfobacteriota bacterium]
MFFDELKVGDEFTSPSKTLTEAHYLLFSGVTGDSHPIHYDVEYARKTRFGKPVAHGLLLASMTALGASSVTHRLEGFIMVEQGCRFIKPAIVGDTIYPRHTVEKIWREDRRGFVRLAATISNQRGETLLEGFHVYQVDLRSGQKEES